MIQQFSFLMSLITFNSFSLRLFDEIHEQNYDVYWNNGLPNVVVLLDTINKYQQFKTIVRKFEKIAAYFIDEVNFMWGDGIFNQARYE